MTDRHTAIDAAHAAGPGSASRTPAPPRRGVGWWLGCCTLITCWLLVGLLALATWAPHVTRFKTDVIIGESMEPTIPLYSLIVVEPVPADRLRVGDVITFDHPDVADTKVTHRITEVGRTPAGDPVFRTRGDNNDVRDPWRVEYAGTGWRVDRHVPHIGWLLLHAQDRLARILLVALPVVLLTSQFLLHLWREPREAEVDLDEHAFTGGLDELYDLLDDDGLEYVTDPGFDPVLEPAA